MFTDERNRLAAALAALLMGAMPIAYSQDPEPANVLLILADDLGIETLSRFGVGANGVRTPSLDELAERGVAFTNVWAQPVCSATRATILTGRYGFRTGVGRQIVTGPALGESPEAPPKPPDFVIELPVGGGMAAVEAQRLSDATTWGPSLEEFTLPMALEAGTRSGYATAAIGKWHLADVRNGWEQHPNWSGFNHFSGLLAGGPESYSAWVKVVDGTFSAESGYAPADKVSDALAWIEAQREPWFVWLNFNLVHVPIHRPPREWLGESTGDLDIVDQRQRRLAYFDAMIEALDAAVGRTLDGLAGAVLDNTYVIFMGDNGTRGSVIRSPFDRLSAKGTLYQGGVHVPLIVAGPGVRRGGVSGALVNSTDLFATVLEMAGAHVADALPEGAIIDSVSLMPYLSEPGRASIRAWAYADLFPGSDVADGRAAIRDERFKLIRGSGQDEFYDLAEDPYERNELLANGDLGELAAARYRALSDWLGALHASED